MPFKTCKPQELKLKYSYIRSPIVNLVVGSGNETIPVHESYLQKSPWLADKCNALSASDRAIHLPTEDIDAIGAVLEYLYIGEYFPRRTGPQTLEPDPCFPTPDSNGDALLRHARVYTRADKFQLPALKSLAHAKIHRTTSTARGEIAYARYVYSVTDPDDTVIRTPVAAFWATRSHVLRHEAEDEFRTMCMEFPQFGFDVLSRVLDQREKGSQPSINSGASSTGKGKKRPRVSSTG